MPTIREAQERLGPRFEPLKKYASIDLRGREAAFDGIIEKYKWPDGLERLFLTAAEFGSEAVKVVEERLTTKLAELEKRLPIKFFLAGRDQILHSTVQAGQINDAENDPAQQIMKLTEVDELMEVEKSLEGTKVEFASLLFDKNNLILVASKIPEKILAARNRLSVICRENSLLPLPMTNIVHCTISRIVELPSDLSEKQKALAEYHKVIRELQLEISNDPIFLEIAKVNSQSVADFLAIISKK